MPDSIRKDAVVVREDHLPYLDLYKRNDGIVKIVTARNLRLTKKEAHEISTAVNKFTGRVSHPMLFVVGQHTGFDKEFFLDISSGETLSFTAVLAFVIPDVTERNIAGTLLAVHSPAMPILFFEDEIEALAWLTEQFRRSAVTISSSTSEHALKGEGITITSELHQRVFDLYKRSDNIVVLVCKDYAWLTVKEIKELINGVKEITSGVPHRILVVVGKKTSIDKEARSYSVTAEADQYALATAVVINSWPQRVIGNIMVTVDQPKKPLKFFDSIKEASAWLKVQH